MYNSKTTQMPIIIEPVLYTDIINLKKNNYFRPLTLKYLKYIFNNVYSSMINDVLIMIHTYLENDKNDIIYVWKRIHEGDDIWI